MQNGMKTLFAIDFSSSAQTTLQLLSTIAKRYELDMYLSHVISSYWRDWISSGQYEKEITERLLTWQKKLSGKTNPSHIVIDKGHVAKTLARLANDLDVQTIFLGAGGKASENAIGSGTSVSSVVRLAKQSVWVCQRDKINNILCGIDGSAQSAKALREAINIARTFNAKLTLVAVIQPMSLNPLGMSERELSQAEDDHKQQHIADMQSFIREFSTDNLTIDVHYPWGQPGIVLAHMALDFNEDLVVVGATGKSGITGLLIGSTVDKLLSHLPCSLLVVR